MCGTWLQIKSCTDSAVLCFESYWSESKFLAVSGKATYREINMRNCLKNNKKYWLQRPLNLFLNPCYIKISKIRSDIACFLRSSASNPSSRISPTRSGHHQHNACHVSSSRPHVVDWEVINDIATKTVLKLRQSLWKSWKVWSCFVVILGVTKIGQAPWVTCVLRRNFRREPAEADIRKRWWLSKRRLIQWNRVQSLVKQNRS